MDNLCCYTLISASLKQNETKMHMLKHFKCGVSTVCEKG